MFDIVSRDSNIFLVLLLVAVGFVLIIYGGNFFVESAIWIAKISKIPEIIIGATIVSIGTTLPEMIVSFVAAGTGQNSMAVGNALGSVLCNTSLILGLTLAFSSTKIKPGDFMPKNILLTLSVVFIAISCANKRLDIWEAVVLMLFFAVFVAYSLINARQEQKKLKGEGLKSLGEIADAQKASAQPSDEHYKKKNPAFMIIMFVVGAAGIAAGAGLLVDSVSALAEKINISQQIISLTVVALGTSLPELVTSITSLKKNNAAISIGNIIGADILNTTLILGGSGLIAGGIDVLSSDLISILVTLVGVFVVIALLTIPILIKKRTFRWQGIVLISVYVIYLGIMITQAVLS